MLAILLLQNLENWAKNLVSILVARVILAEVNELAKVIPNLVIAFAASVLYINDPLTPRRDLNAMRKNMEEQWKQDIHKKPGGWVLKTIFAMSTIGMAFRMNHAMINQLVVKLNF